MNLYKISQSENYDWDTFDSAVVAAEDEDDARSIHPGSDDEWTPSYFGQKGSWVWDKAKVKVVLIGTAAEGVKRGVIVSSFNAG